MPLFQEPSLLPQPLENRVQSPAESAVRGTSLVSVLKELEEVSEGD